MTSDNTIDFAAIENELLNIKILTDGVDSMMDSEFDIAFLNIVGATLIQLQIVEFALLGAISHLKENLLSLDKRFKDLTPQRFLSSNAEDSIYRKQTLGVIIEFVKRNMQIFDNDSLEIFLQNRNKFVHNFWREYLSYGKDKVRTDKLKAYHFAIMVYEDSIKWTSIFKGFIYEVALYIAKNNNKDIESFAHLKRHHQTFLDSVKIKSQ